MAVHDGTLHTLDGTSTRVASTAFSPTRLRVRVTNASPGGVSSCSGSVSKSGSRQTNAPVFASCARLTVYCRTSSTAVPRGRSGRVSIAISVYTLANDGTDTATSERLIADLARTSYDFFLFQTTAH